MNLEIIIPSDEPVRLLNAVTEELDYRRLTATYSRLGRIEYSPRLLFKIVLYGCSRGIYGTREIERACRENVNFMYLLEGHRPPDHNTIARFRKEHLPYAVEDLLNQMVKLLVQWGEISFEESAVFIDGTKIEANANRYSFVWKTAVTKRQAKLGEKIAEELPKLLEASATGIVAPYIIECADCKNCPVKEKCIRQKKTDKTPLEDRRKRLNVSKYFIQQREAMEKKISTDEGILLRINRSIQAEGVFAMVKEDMNFRRFLTRGNANVMVEWYLVSMAFNILKLHHKIQTGRLGNHLFVPGAA